jgi:hypothetical protein
MWRWPLSSWPRLGAESAAGEGVISNVSFEKPGDARDQQKWEPVLRPIALNQ